MGVDVIVVAVPDEAAAEASRHLARRAAAGGALVLAGGSTPRRAYELAATLEPDWSAAEVWFGDERCVPHDDERSNALLVRRSLLERLEVAPRAVHLVPTELPPPEAAAAYDAALRGVALDLVLLGLGPDGHTASLFPRAASLSATDRFAVEASAGLEPFVPRVTMTVAALSSAAEIVFLAVGAEKAEAARRAFGDVPSQDTPASLVRSAAGATTVILDEGAAALLPQRIRSKGAS
jgi:6-phosphogluconolactonase